MKFRQRVRAWLEQRLSRFYEGPEPPVRYAQQVALFAQLNPEATADEWKRFAEVTAEGAYREGYVRGVEWRERDQDAQAERDAEERARHEWELAQTKAPQVEQVIVDKAHAQAIHEEGVRQGAWWLVE